MPIYHFSQFWDLFFVQTNLTDLTLIQIFQQRKRQYSSRLKVPITCWIHTWVFWGFMRYEDMRFCPSACGIPLLLKCNYLFPFVCFCFPCPSLLYSFPVLSYTRLLAPPPPPPQSHKNESISVIYSPQGLPVILTAPLWSPWWHPNSTERRSWPPPAPP